MKNVILAATLAIFCASAAGVGEINFGLLDQDANRKLGTLFGTVNSNETFVRRYVKECFDDEKKYRESCDTLVPKEKEACMMLSFKLKAVCMGALAQLNHQE